MTRTVLVAGTASHVGKSTVAAGLCRLLADRGVTVAPFKGQNMSNNARAVPKSVGSDGTDEEGDVDTKFDEADGDTAFGEADGDIAFGEIGVSQYVQARAARVSPETDHNPVLLKPRGEGESQLVLDGEAVAHYAAGDYYDEHWHDARAAAEAAHRRLTAKHDVIVAEGAGSIAEINLQDRDIANVETARFADADVLLVADIERGGVFASLVGTLELLPDDLRERVVGAVITKFRGDVALLEPGLEAFEERTGVPVLGVIPYADPGLPEEDSVALPDAGERAVRGAEDGIPEDRTITVAVPRLPRVSNFTDLEPLAAVPGVRVAYVPVADGSGSDPLVDVGADAVVIPGTKNTVDDLLALRKSGFDDAIRRFSGPIVGLCGGYQLLGERILNANVEGTGDWSEETDGDETEAEDRDETEAEDRDETEAEDRDETEAEDRDETEAEDGGGNGTEAGDENGEVDGGRVIEGIGRLPVETVFSREKRVAATEFVIEGSGPLKGAAGTVSGYEIHMGETRLATGDEADDTELRFPFSETGDASTDGRNGAALGAAFESNSGGGTSDVLGTYLHDLFANEGAREAFVDRVYAHTGLDRPIDAGIAHGSPYDCAADLLREHVDLSALHVVDE